MKRGSFDYLLDPTVKLEVPPVVIPPSPRSGGGGPQRIHIQIEITDRPRLDPGPSILARLVGLVLFVIMLAWLAGCAPAHAQTRPPLPKTCEEIFTSPVLHWLGAQGMMATVLLDDDYNAWFRGGRWLMDWGLCTPQTIATHGIRPIPLPNTSSNTTTACPSVASQTAAQSSCDSYVVGFTTHTVCTEY